jgi:pyruvate carboxylase
MEMVTTPMRVDLVRVCRDGAIDVAIPGVVVGVIVTLAAHVVVGMAVHCAIDMRMHMPVFVTMDGTFDACFAGTATASRAHFRILQIRQS